MIEYDLIYHIDDIVLSNFCPNTNRLEPKVKYKTFFRHLSSFHVDQDLYLGTPSGYSAFILNRIILNSLELNKNILSYESYLYNVLIGYSKRTKRQITAQTRAKLWTNFVLFYEKLIKYTTHDKIKHVYTLSKEIDTTRFINSDVTNNQYSWLIPIQVLDVYDKLTNILMIPIKGKENIYTNAVVLNTINRYPSANLAVITINIDTAAINIVECNVSKLIVKHATEYVKNSFVDFSRANLYACPVCPLIACTTSNIIDVAQPVKLEIPSKVKVRRTKIGNVKGKKK